MNDNAGSGTPAKEDKGEVDLYELLGVDKTASSADLKKAYRKVPEERRAESEAKFKAVTQAYDILRDDEKRQLYDQFGMAAFDPTRGGGMGGGDGVDLNDIIGQMFGMNMGGAGGPGGPGGVRRPRRGRDEEQQYTVTLEELYRGKTAKFAANKHVVCATCKGSGAKDKVKPQPCERCRGVGVREAYRQIGPGLIRQETLPCDHCEGAGTFYKEKDRCRKCHGRRIVDETKALELYIPRGAHAGERIVLEGEADQAPDQIPGDLVFTLVEAPHATFSRIGPDLAADLHVTLAEALCGFSRVILTHLDGRGLHITHPRGKILRPGQVLKVAGEGMPQKRGDGRGDLYLSVKIDFPPNDWLTDDADYAKLTALLPPPSEVITADEIDEVEYDDDADLEQDGRGNNVWEDGDDDEEQGGPQCATQ